MNHNAVCNAHTWSSAEEEDEDDDQSSSNVWSPLAGILHDDNFVYIFMHPDN